MANITCPKCGYQQEGGEECQNCGIIFSRFVPPPEIREIYVENGVLRVLYR